MKYFFKYIFFIYSKLTQIKVAKMNFYSDSPVDFDLECSPSFRETS